MRLHVKDIRGHRKVTLSIKKKKKTKASLKRKDKNGPLDNYPSMQNGLLQKNKM